MDRLLEDLAVKYPPKTDINFGLKRKKKGWKLGEDKRPMKLKEEEVMYEWKRTLELALELRKWRDGLSEEEVALLKVRP
jgi:hypothetical protein